MTQKDLLYVIPADKHDPQSLKEILAAHPEIQFVSVVGKTYLCCCSSFTYHSFDKWPRLPSGLFIFIKETVFACFNENGSDREYRFYRGGIQCQDFG